MSSFELNKFLGAILGTCLVVVALNITAGALFAPEAPVKPGYNIVVEEQPKGGSPAIPAQEQQPFEVALASASPERGANAAKVCGTCHTFTKGGANGLGPNLYGVVGRKRASEPGFDYSAAMKAKASTWTIDELNQFLTKPQAYAPGTAMAFPGYSRTNQRADVIAYLNTLSDNPKPLPKAAATQTPPAAAAPAANTGAVAPVAPVAPPPAAAPPAGAGAKPSAPAAANTATKPGAPAPSNPPPAAPAPKSGAPASPEAKPTPPGRVPRP
jgi:cytochrome c